MRKILLLAPSFPPDVDGGGPTQSLGLLAEEAHANGFDVTVIAPAAKSEVVRIGAGETPGMVVIRASGLRRIRALWRLRDTSFNHVVVSTFWSPTSLLDELFRLARIIRTEDLVLTPRGQLNPGPLETSRTKKVLAFPFYRFVARRAVSRFIATSEAERQSIETLLARDAILANQAATPLSFSAEPPIGGGGLNVGFVSRIHPRKGLVEVISALSMMRSDVRFFIAGNIQDGRYWSRCEEAIADLPGNVEVVRAGLVPRDRLEDLLRRLDVLVLVSSGENFGHAIAEALQVGVRVVICPDTPWSAPIESTPLAGAVMDYPASRTELSAMLDSWAEADLKVRRDWRRAARNVFDAVSADGTPSVMTAIMASGGER